ncbi:MAG TPA: aminoglycoside phosphotransferase family protein [Hyphomonadaceae bacterium]|jgi:aminoglycoside phosphotransferase (APT) family kinase protein|nr:aminoglycoside phosphotransferase family protein [Hyphomonadaceae bacterium]
MAGKLHEDEIGIGEALARRLVASQFPQWKDLPLVRVPAGGTDNAVFRLGADMAVRLPRRPSAAEQVEKEQRFLPGLQRSLPLAIPAPIAAGRPGEGYPWSWSICGWIEGEAAFAAPFDEIAAARDLAPFIGALHRIDAAGGPAPGPHNFFRGVPLAQRDRSTRAAIVKLVDMFEADELTVTWEQALHTPAWSGPPKWIHGDLHPGNILVQDRRISGVIDFGGLGVGDPACDLMAAWTVLGAEGRAAFRDALNVIEAADDDAWSRGRCWALSFGVIALAYYRDSDATLSGIARRSIEQALGDASG